MVNFSLIPSTALRIGLELSHQGESITMIYVVNYKLELTRDSTKCESPHGNGGYLKSVCAPEVRSQACGCGSLLLLVWLGPGCPWFQAG